MRHNFVYFAKEGITNMFTHGFMSFAAIGITIACLIIMGTFSLVALNAQNLLDELESENEILAYVDDTLTREEALGIEKELEQIPNVSDATFVSRETAMKAFQEKYADDPLFADLDEDTLRHRYVIRTIDIEQTRATKEAVENTAGIAKVNAYEAVADGFVAIRNIAGIVCIALITILFLVSMFIISNTIKLTTFDRRDEIAIMKMVGATDAFIRWPFVYEGLMFGIFSAVIGFGLQWGLYEAVSVGIDNSDTIQLLHLIEFSEICVPVAVIFLAAGTFIGVYGSLAAIRKFLQV
ncbi:MAG: permease-like cell division protein FtsX [Oscillospiraceae bacterium]|nr:permease-like cell division protein FtsX [Oscillospiraceae bacterium]